MQISENLKSLRFPTRFVCLFFYGCGIFVFSLFFLCFCSFVLGLLFWDDIGKGGKFFDCRNLCLLFRVFSLSQGNNERIIEKASERERKNFLRSLPRVFFVSSLERVGKKEIQVSADKKHSSLRHWGT